MNKIFNLSVNVIMLSVALIDGAAVTLAALIQYVWFAVVKGTKHDLHLLRNASEIEWTAIEWRNICNPPYTENFWSSIIGLWK